MFDDSQLTALTDRFHAAALGADTWQGALEALAEATGSRAGQLIGIGADKAVPFNWITNFDPELIAEFAAINGGDPAVNPRVRAGIEAPVFQVLAESDFMTAEEHRKDPLYADFFTRGDIPFICLTNIIKERDMLIGLTVNRSAREGNAGEDVRRIISAVAPHVRAAVRTQIALEGQGPSLIAGAMDALSIAAFVCDRHGRVLARASSTESLVNGEGPLRLIAGHLSAARPDQAEALRGIIAAAATGKPQLHGVAVSGKADEPPVILDVAALPPRPFAFSMEARVLVVARSAARDDAARMSLLRSAFALTVAEAEIAIALMDGLSSPEIAAKRSASVHTVRSQIKALYGKLEVSSRAELAARLALVR